MAIIKVNTIGVNRLGKAQAIRRSVRELKIIQAKRGGRTEQDNTRLLAFGVCDSINYATGSTGKWMPTAPLFSRRESVVMKTIAAVFVMLILCAAFVR